MAVAEACGLPVAVSVASATPHKASLVGVALAAPSIEAIASHRKNRQREPTQDGRPMRG
jgi:hypothetical protein